MTESSREERNAALLVASFASFLTPFMGSSINVALPLIGEYFNANAILLSWVATSYILGAAVFLIPLGRAADIIGRKRIFLLGIIIFTIASFFCGLAGSMIMLIVLRVIQAVGSAMIFGAGMAVITSVFPVRERGKAMGIAVAAVYIGLTLGPFAGGILTEHLGWRSIFFSVVPLGIIVIWFVLKKLKGEWTEAKGEKFDWTGSVLYGGALSMIMYSFSKIPECKGFILMGGGLIILLFFIIHQLKVSYPVFELKLFKNNITFRYSNLAALINYSATYAIGFLLSFYLQKVRGMGAQETGLILVSSPVMMAILSPLAGRLSDSIEPRILSSAGMAISAIGLTMLISLSDNTGIIYLVSVLLFMGIGFALFSSPNTNAIMSSVEKKYLGVASGSLGTMRLVGQMFSMGIVMMLFTLFIGKVEINPSNLDQLIKAIKIAFAIFSALCFTGIFASLARGNVRND